MKLEIGKLLKPKQPEFDDSTAEIIGYNNRTNKWHIIVDDHLTAWRTKEQIEKEFEEIDEDRT